MAFECPWCRRQPSSGSSFSAEKGQNHEQGTADFACPSRRRAGRMNWCRPLPRAMFFNRRTFVAKTVSMINMKGGVGKTTLTFNLAWHAAWMHNLRVLAVDLDPQANLSQYFMGAEGYLDHINERKATVV